MAGFSIKASPQNAAGTAFLSYYKFYPAAFSIGGEAKRTQYHAPYMRCPTLLTPQPTALRRSALIQGKAHFYRREHTTAYVTKKKGALTQ